MGGGAEGEGQIGVLNKYRLTRHTDLTRQAFDEVERVKEGSSSLTHAE